MNPTLEQRVAELEKQVAEMQRADSDSAKPRLAWKKNIGWAKNDPMYEEAMKYAEEYRRTGRIEGDPAS